MILPYSFARMYVFNTIKDKVLNIYKMAVVAQPCDYYES